jgi:hypothetical protein
MSLLIDLIDADAVAPATKVSVVVKIIFTNLPFIIVSFVYRSCRAHWGSAEAVLTRKPL